MQINSITISGIGSYGDRQPVTIHFAPKTLLLGSNGVGKSWIAEAIALCLFGKTIRRLDLDQLVYHSCRVGEASLEFTIQNQRYKAQFFRDKELHTSSNQLSIWDAERNRFVAVTTDQTISRTYDMIAELIGFDWNDFRQSGFFGQNDVSIFIAGTDKQKRQTLVNMLNLDRFNEAFNKIKELANQNNNAISSLHGAIELLTSQLQTDKEIDLPDDEELKLQLQSLERDIATTTDEIKAVQKALHDFEKNQLVSRECKRRCEMLTREVNYRKSELQKKEQNLEEAKTAYQTFNEQILQPLQQYHYMLGYIACLKEHNWEISAILHEQCEQLRQITDSIQWHLLDLPNTDKLTDNIHSLQQVVKRYQSELEQVLTEYQNINSSIEQEDLEQLNEYYRQLQNQLEYLHKQRDDIISELRFIETKKIELYDLNQKLHEYSTLLKQKNEYNDILSALLEALGTKGVPSIILSEVLQQLNYLANFYLARLGGNFSIKFTFEKETKSGIVDELRIVALIGNQQLELNALSGGEKQRVELAVRFAIADLAVSQSSVLILDEVTTGLDEHGLHTLAELLRSLDKQVIAISHEETLTAAFDKVVRLGKGEYGTCVNDVIGN